MNSSLPVNRTVQISSEYTSFLGLALFVTLAFILIYHKFTYQCVSN